jgi:hypothetical protein
LTTAVVADLSLPAVAEEPAVLLSLTRLRIGVGATTAFTASGATVDVAAILLAWSIGNAVWCTFSRCITGNGRCYLFSHKIAFSSLRL